MIAMLKIAFHPHPEFLLCSQTTGPDGPFLSWLSPSASGSHLPQTPETSQTITSSLCCIFETSSMLKSLMRTRDSNCETSAGCTQNISSALYPDWVVYKTDTRMFALLAFLILTHEYSALLSPSFSSRKSKCTTVLEKLLYNVAEKSFSKLNFAWTQ